MTSQTANYYTYALTAEDVRRAIAEWTALYNEHWLIERHGHRSPDAVRRERLAVKVFPRDLPSTLCPGNLARNSTVLQMDSCSRTKAHQRTSAFALAAIDLLRAAIVAAHATVGQIHFAGRVPKRASNGPDLGTSIQDLAGAR